MDAPLLERDAELAVITEALDRACGGTGSVLLLSGEAGIGKTSVVRAFLRSVGEQAGVLHGACDAVLARVRRLSPPAQAALDLLAVVPSGVELCRWPAGCSVS